MSAEHGGDFRRRLRKTIDKPIFNLANIDGAFTLAINKHMAQLILQAIDVSSEDECKTLDVAFTFLRDNSAGFRDRREKPMFWQCSIDTASTLVFNKRMARLLLEAIDASGENLHSALFSLGEKLHDGVNWIGKQDDSSCENENDLPDPLDH